MSAGNGGRQGTSFFSWRGRAEACGAITSPLVPAVFFLVAFGIVGLARQER